MQQICFATSDGRVVIACTNISSFIAEDFVPLFRRSSHKKQAIAIESLLSLRRQTFKSFFTVAVILSKICISGLFSINVLHRVKTGSIKDNAFTPLSILHIFRFWFLRQQIFQHHQEYPMSCQSLSCRVLDFPCTTPKSGAPRFPSALRFLWLKDTSWLAS